MNVNENAYDNIEACMFYKDKRFKIIEKEYGSKLNDYRDEDAEEKEKYINEKSSEFPIHQMIKRRKLDEHLWDFDAVSFYPSAKWAEKSIYPRIKLVIPILRM